MNRKQLLFGQCALALLSIYPVLSLYINNINEVRIIEIILPILMNITIIEIIMFLIKFITKNYISSIVYACIIFYIIMYFKLIDENQMSSIPYWNSVPLVLYITIVLLFIIHKTKLRKVLDKILLFSVIGIIASLSVSIINNIDQIKILSSNETFSDKKVEFIEDNNSMEFYKKNELPNIYYIILDEYSSFKQMKKWYDFDNKEFYDFLKKHNFNIIEDSRNESMNSSTIYITTNLINISYVSVDNNYIKANKLRDQPFLFKLLDKYGYNVNYQGGPQIGWNNSKIKISSTTIEGYTLLDIIYGNNILYPLFEKNINVMQQKELDLYNYLENYINIVKKSSFLYIHFRAGHVPLIFNENTINTPDKFFNNIDKSLYIGQIKYTNSRIMQMVSNIIEKEPDSIIIIQSDHSQRNLRNASRKKIIPVKDSQQVFNAVYYKGETLEFDNTLSGVNTVRLVIDKILNTNLGVIDVP